jgi:hypothetical protein
MSAATREWLRSPTARGLTAAALAAALILGAAFLAMSRLRSSATDALVHPDAAATDEQTKAEVVEQARNMVAINALRQPTAGYLLMSCKDRDDPPYQGAVYMTFALPTDAHTEYFQTLATAMVARGWREGLPPNDHLFGKSLSKDGVTAVVYPDQDSTDAANHGIARIYGQCRDMTNHRGDATGWTDITGQLR